MRAAGVRHGENSPASATMRAQLRPAKRGQSDPVRRSAAQGWRIPGGRPCCVRITAASATPPIGDHNHTAGNSSQSECSPAMLHYKAISASTVSSSGAAAGRVSVAQCPQQRRMTIRRRRRPGQEARVNSRRRLRSLDSRLGDRPVSAVLRVGRDIARWTTGGAVVLNGGQHPNGVSITDYGQQLVVEDLAGHAKSLPRRRRVVAPGLVRPGMAKFAARFCAVSTSAASASRWPRWRRR